MTARKKHIRTSYEGNRKEHRAAASRHVLVFYVADDLRIYGNHLTNIAQKRLNNRRHRQQWRCRFCQ